MITVVELSTMNAHITLISIYYLLNGFVLHRIHFLELVFQVNPMEN
jgi:hypothetical protein